MRDYCTILHPFVSVIEKFGHAHINNICAMYYKLSRDTQAREEKGTEGKSWGALPTELGHTILYLA